MKLSFEFFPPTSAEAELGLWHTFDTLRSLEPDFVSVTYGAAGSTRDRTHRVVEYLRKTATVAPHLTCVGEIRHAILEQSQRYWNLGLRRIVALRGDLPAGYSIPQLGFSRASALVRGLRNQANWDISVATYPELHPESRTLADELNNLQAKFDAGANRAITQFFFDTDSFLWFRERAAARGITEIVPGILPIVRFPQMVKFAERCKTEVPEWLKSRFEGTDQRPDLHYQAAVMTAAELVIRLKAEGVGQFHFYTLNHAELTRDVVLAAGLRGPYERRSLAVS